MAGTKGTFSGTGQSAVVNGSHMDILMDFAGTASVDVEVQMPSGAWVKVETGITADYHKVFDPASTLNVRLNCTAHTNNVEYAISPGEGK